MTDIPMLEKCARAMERAAMDWADAPGNELNIDEECPYPVLAMAMLNTLRNPDAGMVEAGYVEADRMAMVHPDLIFTTMIDHVSKGGE